MHKRKIKVKKRESHCPIITSLSMSKLGVEALLVVLGYRRDKREKTKSDRENNAWDCGTVGHMK